MPSSACSPTATRPSAEDLHHPPWPVARGHPGRPNADRSTYSDRELRARIDVTLGGRTAEEIVFGDVTTGAESDIQQLTRIARQMIGRWGMNATVGPIAVLPPEGLPSPDETSEDTQRLVDQEVRTLVATAHDDVTRLLTERTATISTASPRRCSSTRRSIKPTPTPPPECRPGTLSDPVQL